MFGGDEVVKRGEGGLMFGGERYIDRGRAEH
jgi:hypothetical protein